MVLVLGFAITAQASSPAASPRPRKREAAVAPDRATKAKPTRSLPVSELKPTPLALADIPDEALRLYMETADKYQRGDFSGWKLGGTTQPVKCQIDWRQLAGHGAVESGHGQSDEAGVHSGVNFAKCCAGPMQMSVYRGPNGDKASSWDIYRIDGNGDGYDVYSLEDSIPTAANHLCDRPSRAAPDQPDSLVASILAYNDDWQYMQNVLNHAAGYGRAKDAPMKVLRLPGITFSGQAAFDITAGRISPELVRVITQMAKHYSFRVEIIHTGHCLEVNCDSGVMTLHAVAQAMDIYFVEGAAVSTANVPARQLTHWLKRHATQLNLNEVGNPFSATGVLFTDSHHGDHLHVGVN
jgi:hypothetical protein